MRGLITANLKVLRTYPNDNDESIIAKMRCMTSASTSFSSLDGIGSNIHIVGLADLTRLYNSFSPIVENAWNCSLRGSIVHNLMWYCSWQLHGYCLISNSIDFGSKIVHKVITAVLLGNGGGDSLWGGSFHQRPHSTCHAAAEAEQWLCSQMDQMEGIKTGEPYLLPFPSDPVPAFWDRKSAPWFFPPEKGLDAPPVFFRGGGQGGCRWIFTKHTFAQACCE